jgi:membrane protease subunit HflK
VCLLAAAAYLGSGFYFVQPNERAVVRRFGRIIERRGEPGLHYAWPWPLGRVDRPRTTVRRITVGLDPAVREAIAAGDLVAQTQSPRTDVFTGDVNIVKVTMVAQYQISEPDRYVVAAANPDELVRLSVYSVMVQSLGGTHVDEALTEGKTLLQDTVRSQAQQMLEDYGCGISLSAVDLQAIDPPYAIIDAFKDVASAKKDREKLIDQAVSFANETLPQARGRAFELVAAAEAYEQRRVNQAQGQADRFVSICREYVKAPEVTRTRLLLDTLSHVFEEADTYVFSSTPKGPPLRITISDDSPDR